MHLLYRVKQGVSHLEERLDIDFEGGTRSDELEMTQNTRVQDTQLTQNDISALRDRRGRCGGRMVTWKCGLEALGDRVQGTSFRLVLGRSWS
jgi:hypothetical protein